MNDQNFKNLCLKVFLLKNFENAQKNGKSANIFWRCSQIKSLLKVEIEDGCEAPWKPSIELILKPVNH